MSQSGSSTLSLSLPRPVTGWVRLEKLLDLSQFELGVGRWKQELGESKKHQLLNGPLSQAQAGTSEAIFSFTWYIRLQVLVETLVSLADEKAGSERGK